MKKGVQKRQNSDEEGRTEPEPHLLEISLRESAHGFESHPLRQNKVRPGGRILFWYKMKGFEGRGSE